MESYSAPDKLIPELPMTGPPLKSNQQGSARVSPCNKSLSTREKWGLMAAELTGEWVGPMNSRSFLDKLLPLATGSTPKFNDCHFYNMPCTGIKKDLYAPFIRMVNQASVLPGFKLIDVGDHPDGMSPQGKKNHPDIALYEKDVNTDANKLQYERLECFLELKTLENLQDPFQDPLSKTKHYSLESTTIGGTLCRGQIAGYAAQWCARQHWTHGFAVWIGGYWVRLIRFDRTGGTVSERFDIRTQGGFLLEFFWRLSQLTRAQRGYDTTVRLATPAEEALAKEQLARWKPEKERPVVVMQVPDGDGFREVIAWGSMAEPESLTGRATRGYPVWDRELKRVVFLKDAWRSGEDDVEKETIMLAKLNASKVQFVPKLICGDDLPGQVTETWTLAAEEWNLGAQAEDLVPRVHIRFTEDFIGVDICNFTSSKQFLQVVFDAFTAHREAFENCVILHRDISGGNVMMNENGCGILNDWDLARTVVEIEKGARQPHRSGTWQFMSHALLANVEKLHKLQDDLESFVWLVLYYILHFMEHSKLGDLESIVAGIFEQNNEHRDGTVTGGDGKWIVISKRGHIGGDFQVIGNDPLTRWFDEALHSVAFWYGHHRTVETLQQQASIPGMAAMLKLLPDEKCQPLYDHRAFVKYFETALERKDWPENDPAVPRFEMKKRRRDEDDDEVLKEQSKAKKLRAIAKPENGFRRNPFQNMPAASQPNMPARR
ncbi:hypothetical protein NLJ89_g7536 [Agrocybe chaxingu]|uniref:Fungal-type protein kinase domain-containing protein n=1 Tax=Agrocybe chaxingu TaxID=84603 RepID=A0A9W8MUY8_9AGAR|nr:hypothetical protein NLJ89_g7536 [Agrocybe chaxingu]